MLRCSAFFIVQLSHPYTTTGTPMTLTRWTFVGKVMSLLLNMLSRLVITFIPRSKRLLISWLQSPSAVIFSSVQFSHSLVSDSLQPHESQHARPLCPSPMPRVYPLMSIKLVMPSSHLILCHPLLLMPPIPPNIRVFPMSQLSVWGGQYIGVSASKSVLPMNTQDWSPLGWTGWISLQSKGLARVFSNTTVKKHQFFGTQLSSQSNFTSIHDHWKNHSLD